MSNNIPKKRNLTLDVLKIIASIAVVIIHTRIYGAGYTSIGTTFFEYATRFAVPFFILSAGYFYTGKNLNMVYDLLKKLIVFYILYFTIGIILIPFTDYMPVTYIDWYFYNIAAICILTKSQNKYWLIFLFSISMLWNIGVGNINENINFISESNFYHLYRIKPNNFISYLAIFIVGIYLRKINIKQYSLKTGISFLISACVLIALNGLVFHYSQYNLYNSVIAILLMLAAKNIRIMTNLNFKDTYFSIFFYHCLVLPISTIIIMPTNLIFFIINIVITCILSLIFASIIKLIDRKILNNAIHSI